MNALMYLAFALLPLDNFPFMFGGAYKPVSLILIVLYFALHLPALLRLRFQRKEVWAFVILVSAALISALLGKEHGYASAGLSDAVFSLAAGIVIYLSFKIFMDMNQEKPDAVLVLFRWMLRGYWLAVGIGLLQLVYIYAVPSAALQSFIGFFVHRDAYVTTGRLHFTFSEPSYIGLHTNLLLFPAYLVLSKYGRLAKADKILVVLFVLLSLLSLSIRYYIDLLFFLLAYLVVTSTAKTFPLLMLKLVLIGAVFLALLNTIFVRNVFHLNSDHYYRILHIYEDPASLANDNSFSIRSTYSQLGLASFLDRPLLGYGLGNFHYGYLDNQDLIPAQTLEENEELRQAKTTLVLPQYNMYTRFLSEFGLPGILLFLTLLSLIVQGHRGNFPRLIIILLLYALLQFDSFAFIQVLFWVAFLQHPFVSRLGIGKGEDPAAIGGNRDEKNLRHRPVPAPRPWAVQSAGDADPLPGVQRKIRIDLR